MMLNTDDTKTNTDQYKSTNTDASQNHQLNKIASLPQHTENSFVLVPKVQILTMIKAQILTLFKLANQNQQACHDAWGASQDPS